MNAFIRLVDNHGVFMERTKSIKMFGVHLRFRRQSTDYQQFGNRETLTISMWSTDGADAGETRGKYGLLTQMERCIFIRLVFNAFIRVV